MFDLEFQDLPKLLETPHYSMVLRYLTLFEVFFHISLIKLHPASDYRTNLNLNFNVLNTVEKTCWNLPGTFFGGW